MISVTRQTGVFAAILLLITLALSTIRLYINPFEAELAECAYLPRWWQSILAAIMLFVAAIIVNRASVKVGLFGGFSSLPVSLYGFISCCILLSPNILTAATASLLTAFGTMFLIRSLQFLNDKEALFTGCLLLGSAAVVYQPCITLVAVIPMAIFIFPLNFRQIVIATTGYLLPLLGTSYVNWYMGGEFTNLAQSIYNVLLGGMATLSLQPLPVVTLLLTLMFTLILIYGVMVGTFQRYTLLVPVRKTVQLVLWMLIFSVASLLLAGSGITMLPTIAVPAAIIAAFALDRMNQRWANTLYISIMVLILLHLFLY
ncbi:MAG: hypothetical protein IJX65_08980 [Alistipes sp.]|nr:hypothetical protein [Alistipes sp.]